MSKTQMMILLSLNTVLPLLENQILFSCPAKSKIPRSELNAEYMLELIPLEGSKGFSKSEIGLACSKNASLIVVFPTSVGPAKTIFFLIKFIT